MPEVGLSKGATAKPCPEQSRMDCLAVKKNVGLAVLHSFLKAVAHAVYLWIRAL